jgi:hypothetical protein
MLIVEQTPFVGVPVLDDSSKCFQTYTAPVLLTILRDCYAFVLLFVLQARYHNKYI